MQRINYFTNPNFTGPFADINISGEAKASYDANTKQLNIYGNMAVMASTSPCRKTRHSYSPASSGRNTTKIRIRSRCTVSSQETTRLSLLPPSPRMRTICSCDSTPPTVAGFVSNSIRTAVPRISPIRFWNWPTLTIKPGLQDSSPGTRCHAIKTVRRAGDVR